MATSEVRREATVVRGLGDPRPYLLPAETVVVGVRRHPMVLLAALLETIGFIAAALMIQYLFEYTPWVGSLMGFVVVAALVRLGYLIIEWRMERFVISNQRMLLINGVITRRIAAVPLRKITDLTFEKPLIGQIFGYGTFVIESAGQDQAMSHVAYLPHANRLYLKVSDLLFGTGVPQVEADLVADPQYDPDDDGLVIGNGGISHPDREPGADVAADRRDTDPDLGRYLAGMDFSQDYSTEPVPPPHGSEWADMDILGQKPSSGERMRAALGGIHGKGRQRPAAQQDPLGEVLRESRPPRWTR